MHKTKIPLVALSALWLPGYASNGQTPVHCEQWRIFASDVHPGDNFAWTDQSVSISGPRAIVGAPKHAHDGVVESGAAYIFEFDEMRMRWKETELLDPVVVDDFRKYGTSVAIDGDIAIVAQSELDNKGRVYAYHFKNGVWEKEPQELVNPTMNANFGRVVDVQGNAVIVGAFREDLNSQGVDAGGAYIFRYDGKSWAQEIHLPNPTPLNNDGFGIGVAIDGPPGEEIAIVGAGEEDTEALANVGAAYIYRRQGGSWGDPVRLEHPQPEAEEQFGYSVDIRGDRAIVGAYLDGPGSAHIFELEGASWEHKREFVGPEAEGQFGIAVGLDEDVAFVSDTFKSGTAYVYHFDGMQWNEELRLFGRDSGMLGSSVSISEKVAIAGSLLADMPDATDGGAAFLYDLDCDRDGEFNWVEIARGTSMDENNNGFPDECEEPICLPDIEPFPCPDRVVDALDLLALLVAWGPNPGHPADLDDDDQVSTLDLLVLLGAWGPCPIE